MLDARLCMLLLLALFLPSCSGGGSSDEGALKSCDPFVFSQPLSMRKFYRGNTHTHHESRSDLVDSIEDVAAWYRNAGYNFFVLTNHDISSMPGEYFAHESEEFVIIAGEEVSSATYGENGEFIPVHVNAICSNGSTVGGVTLVGADRALTDAVDRTVDIADAIAQINHPNFFYALTVEDIASAKNARLFEIANQHPAANNAGDDDHLSSEQKWDYALSQGNELFGVASDDAHWLPPVALPFPFPGTGWIQVAAQGVTYPEICTAIEEGMFYASTGVELSSISVTETDIQLTIEPGDGSIDSNFTTFFIGRGGELLQASSGLMPSYQLGDDVGYVRARIVSSEGKVAWTQASRIVPAECPM
jgi:hypothetical protein